MRPTTAGLNSKVEIGQIRAARAMLGWTQRELAERAEISQRTIAGIELATVKPKAETLQRIVACFQAAGIKFSRTRDYWPQVALMPSSSDVENDSPDVIDEDA